MATKREIRTYAQINNCSIQEARDHFINEAKKRRGVPEHADDFANKRYKQHDWDARKAVIENDGTFIQTRCYDHSGKTLLHWFNIGICGFGEEKKNPIAEFLQEHAEEHAAERILINAKTGSTKEDTPALRLLGDISSAFSHFQSTCIMRAEGKIPNSMMSDQDEQNYAGVLADFIHQRCRQVFSNTREVMLEFTMVATGDPDRPYAFGARTAELRDKDGALIADLLCPQPREGVTLH